MRFMTAAAAFTLTAAIAVAAFAADKVPGPAAAAPAKAADKAPNSLAPALPRTNPNTATTPVAPEPNFKEMERIAHSPLITDAPLPSDFVLGSRTAPIIMIEYASLSCPHCAHFSRTTLPLLIKKYVDTGKMMYIMRPFPLNAPALKAADLLECVGEQDSHRYYTFAKVLFDAQGKWAYSATYMTNLETIAQVGGVSKAQFDSCMNNTDIETKVLTIKKEANDQLKLPHTPYIFIGGKVYDGDRGIVPMSMLIEHKLSELAKAKSKK